MKHRLLLMFMVLVPIILLSQNRIFVNPSFETGPGIPTYYNWLAITSQAASSPDIDGWYSTHPTYGVTDFPIKLWTANNNPPPLDGDFFVEENLTQACRLYQFVYLTDGDTVEYEGYHRKNKDENTEETIEYNIYSQDGSTKDTTIYTHTATGTEWNQMSGSFTFEGTTGVYQLGVEVIAPTGQGGNLLDNISIDMDPFTEFYQSTRIANEGELPFFVPPHVIVNGKVSDADTIYFKVDPSSSAVAGVDYYFDTATIVPAGYYGIMDSIPLGLTLIEDDQLEEDKTLIIHIDNVTGDLSNVDSNGDGYVGTLTITIQDNDADHPAITSLAEALDVPYPGVFDFDINGTTFETYVNSNGWVLIASDVGDLVQANLPQVTLLSGLEKDILSEDVLASMTGIEKIWFSTTGSSMDVTTTNDTLTSRIKNFTTLHLGMEDNEYNDGWTGVGAINLTKDATCESPSPTTLDAKIFHLCGVSGTHWMPFKGFRSQVSNTNSDPNVSFYLWVAARSTITWTGGSNNTDWNDTGNWDGGVPEQDDNVVIPTNPSGNTVFPVIGNGVVARCFNLTVRDGASLEIENGGELIME